MHANKSRCPFACNVAQHRRARNPTADCCAITCREQPFDGSLSVGIYRQSTAPEINPAAANTEFGNRDFDGGRAQVMMLLLIKCGHGVAVHLQGIFQKIQVFFWQIGAIDIDQTIAQKIFINHSISDHWPVRVLTFFIVLKHKAFAGFVQEVCA
jgi:hypothetical protein